MTAADYPRRLRLRGGRNTHGAKAARTPKVTGHGENDLLVTACGYASGPRDELKPDDAPVTCRNCTREMNR